MACVVGGMGHMRGDGRARLRGDGRGCVRVRAAGAGRGRAAWAVVALVLIAAAMYFGASLALGAPWAAGADAGAQASAGVQAAVDESAHVEVAGADKGLLGDSSAASSSRASLAAPVSAQVGDSEDDAAPTRDAARVLFVGNSFTYSSGYGVAEALGALAAANGKSFEFKRVTYGGAKLSEYAVPRTGTEGRYDAFTKQLSNGRWDYVVLQEKTTYPATDPVEMYCSARLLVERIRAAQPDARVLLYMTSGFSDGSKTLVNGASRVLSTSQLQAYVQGYYSLVGEKLGVGVVPAGMCIYKYGVNAPSASLVRSDDKHPSPLAYFIAACAFYESVFGEGPQQAADYAGIDEADQQLAFSLLGRELDVSPTGACLAVGESVQLTPGASAGSDDSESGTAAENGDAGGGEAPGTDGAGAGSDSSAHDDFGLAAGAETGGGSSGEGEAADVGGFSDDVVLSSVDGALASVTADGVVTGRKAGRTTIVAQAATGERATCYVSVESASLLKSKIAFSQSSFALGAGTTKVLMPQVSESLGAYALTWKSSKPSVATVDALGGVTGVKAGKATITATDAVSGASASCTAVVKLAAPTGVSVAKTTAKKKGKRVRAVKVTWTPVSGATAYKVYRAVGSSNSFKYIAKVKKAKYVNKVPPRNKLLKYKVVAVNGKSTYASETSTAARGVSLGKQTLKLAKAKGGAKVLWKKNAAASGYQVYRRAKGAGSYRLVKTITSPKTTSWVDTTMPQSGAYQYKVRSVRVLDGRTFRGAFSKVKSVKATVSASALPLQAA